MKVVNRHRLHEFWLDHSRSENALRAWHQFIGSYDWRSPDSLRATFPSVTFHQDLTIFDIRGSAYFLITTIDYERRRVYVRDVQVHSDFRNDEWKSLAATSTPNSESAGRSYSELMLRFELRPVQSTDDLRQARAMLDRLLGIREPSQDQQDYLDVLTLIIEDYEARAVQTPSVSAAEVLRFLIMEHRLSQAELIPLLGGKNKVAELLQGKRSLDLRQVTRASRYFRMPSEVFMDPDDLEDEP